MTEQMSDKKRENLRLIEELRALIKLNELDAIMKEDGLPEKHRNTAISSVKRWLKRDA